MSVRVVVRNLKAERQADDRAWRSLVPGVLFAARRKGYWGMQFFVCADPLRHKRDERELIALTPKNCQEIAGLRLVEPIRDQRQNFREITILTPRVGIRR